MNRSCLLISGALALVLSSVTAAESRDIVPLVVGGSNVRDDRFSFIVSLQDSFGNTPTDHHFCGGSFITDQNDPRGLWVLSAAHCMPHGEPNFRILFGATNLNDNAMIELTPDYYFVHNDYNPATFENDVAVIRVHNTTHSITPISINQDPAMEAAGMIASVAGWGAKREGGNNSPKLQATQVPLVSNADCANQYSSIGWLISPVMICAGRDQGGKDSCQGDSGGPLVVQDPFTNAMSLIGVVSFGEGCARQHKPGVYTRTSEFVSWVEEHMSLERPAPTPRPTYISDACSKTNPCPEGMGDCDMDNECQPGLRCVNNVGSSYGYSSYVDVCVNATALPPTPQPSFDEWTACTIKHPCGHGLGDCDSDAECLTGLVCTEDLGSLYGFSEFVDVCIDPAQTSPPSPPPSEVADDATLAPTQPLDLASVCTLETPCAYGEAGCTTDDQCNGNLICNMNSGTLYGYSDPTENVCGRDPSPPTRKCRKYKKKNKCNAWESCNWVRKGGRGRCRGRSFP